MSGSNLTEPLPLEPSATKKYAVIFTADVKRLDEQYSEMASRMRSLAMEQHGCLDFIAVTEGEKEVAISYWSNLSDIARWKKNAEHLVAQKLGRERWYRSYKVEVVELLRCYSDE